MCGIYGTNINYSKELVLQKIHTTNHRGPDYLGYLSIKRPNGEELSFGHNRLAIIDLDSRSNQPFKYQTISIVFNGEIYNYKELRNVLISKGYVFNTESDTEVICATYLEFGEDCVNHFNGMFAFVIYDIKKDLLFGARDRMGQKPLYIYRNGTEIEFASQLSPIQFKNSKLGISEVGLHQYLSWGYIPEPFSIYKEIERLRPGFFFKFNLSNGNYETQQYYDINRSEQIFKGSYEDAKIELKNLLLKSVKRRMIADVPLGVFLSGGIDSSLIASIAAQISPRVKTFSVKFDQEGFDESIYAQKVATILNTNHHTIECNPKEGLSLFENFCEYYDEPFADSSAIPSMLLSKYTRQYVTVALSGDGGDESFLGYHRYNWLTYLNYIYQLPEPLRANASKLLKWLPHYKLNVIGHTINHTNLEDSYLGTMYHPNADWLDFKGVLPPIDELKYLQQGNKNIYERAGLFDLKTYLSWDINTKVDRATMAFSLEARSPFLDYEIVDFANSLPTHFKFEKNNQKKILKDILYGYAPKSLFDRPKAGFTIPFKEWFKNEMKEFILDTLSPKSLESIPFLSIDKVAKKIENHINGRENNYPMIWKLLILKQWINRYGKDLKTV